MTDRPTETLDSVTVVRVSMLRNKILVKLYFSIDRVGFEICLFTLL